MDIFTDAQELAKQYPETFFAPEQDELYKLKTGSTVKVCAADERFWCVVVEIQGEKVIAKVDNDLWNTDSHGIRCDDLIAFEKRHIYDVWKDN